jgi:hypothetical protein
MAQHRGVPRVYDSAVVHENPLAGVELMDASSGTARGSGIVGAEKTAPDQEPQPALKKPLSAKLFTVRPLRLDGRRRGLGLRRHSAWLAVRSLVSEVPQGSAALTALSWAKASWAAVLWVWFAKLSRRGEVAAMHAVRCAAFPWPPLLA